MHPHRKRMRIFTVSFCIFLSVTTAGQPVNYQSLIDSVFSERKAMVVMDRTLSKFDLDPANMYLYAGNYEYLNGKKLDTIMFGQIIQNSLMPDTSFWQDKELKKHLIVRSRNEKITREYAESKYDLDDTAQVKLIEKQLNSGEVTDGYYRNIYSFSRPVFDNSKQFAIVQWDNGHAGKAGGGGIILYQLINNAWTKSGIVVVWVH